MDETIIELLRGQLSFSGRCEAFSPHYSRVGLSLEPTFGLGTLVAAYNRKVTLLTERFLEPRINGEPITVLRQENNPVLVDRYSHVAGLAAREQITGIEFDVYAYELELRNEGRATVSVRLTLGGSICTATGYPLTIDYDPKFRALSFSGRLVRSDERDPEESFPLWLTVVLPAGARQIHCGDRTLPCDQPCATRLDGSIPLSVDLGERDVPPAEACRARITLAVGLGEDALPRRADEAIAASAISTPDAVGCTRTWHRGAIPNVCLPKITEQLQRLYARCVYTLVSNTVQPHDRFRPYRAVFPNRGTYASHYLWDACFQSLGYQYIHTDVTAESLWLLIHRQEPDGKIPQFSCATWNRPGAAQPPLIAWAATTLDPHRRHSQLFPFIYEPLCRWNRWWFSQRDEDGDGLCEYAEALESGWDNSPRWDHGRTEPLDLNAFLVRQMAGLAEIATHLGRPHEAVQWQSQRDQHAQRMLDQLYFCEENIFYDRLYDSHAPIRVKTPASFLPLWAGVPLPEDLARRSIETYLLSPDHFFGRFPFPVVAYSEPTYAPEHWWRGPIWPNIAYLMTDLLGRYGYEQQRRQAITRLVEMIAASGGPYELYNSQTGAPMGAAELGWTAAVTIRWLEDLATW